MKKHIKNIQNKIAIPSNVFVGEPFGRSNHCSYRLFFFLIILKRARPLLPKCTVKRYSRETTDPFLFLQYAFGP